MNEISKFIEQYLTIKLTLEQSKACEKLYSNAHDLLKALAVTELGEIATVTDACHPVEMTDDNRLHSPLGELTVQLARIQHAVNYAITTEYGIVI